MNNAYSKIYYIQGNFIDNSVTSLGASANGGAIWNSDTLRFKSPNSTFLNNYAKSASGTARGGAIYTTKDLNIVADNGQSVFRGNYTEENGKRDDNAIYADQGAAVNFEVKITAE